MSRLPAQNHKIQWKISMDNQNVVPRLPEVHNFLKDLFGRDWPDVWVTGIPGDPNDRANKPCWKGDRAGDIAQHLRDTDNLYYSISVVRGSERKAADFVRGPIIALDDIGSKVNEAEVLAALGEPRWAVETSPGNAQFVYKLDQPIEDQRILDRIMRAMAAKGWTDPGAIDVVRAMRLPAGINGKPKYGSPSPKVRPFDHNQTRILGFADLCLALGLDPIGTLDPDNYAPLQVSTKVGGSADLTKPDLWLKALMDLGRVIGPGREVGVVDIECPFSDEHTAREESGTSYFGRGAFKCHHGHCAGRTNWDFKEKIQCLADDKNGRGWTAGVAFDTPIDEAAIDRISRAVCRAGGDDGYLDWTDATSRVRHLDDENLFFDLWRQCFLSYRAFDAKMSRVVPFGSTGMKSATSIFINGRGRTIGGATPLFANSVTYAPGKPVLVAGDLNRWQPAGLVLPPPASIGDREVEPWLDHMNHVFPDVAARETALDWMSFVLQKPGIKINWAPLIQGGQGIGKDTAFVPLVAGVGPKNVSIVTSQQLESQFNSWLVTQVVIVEEVAAFGKVDYYNRLKTYLAAPPAELALNEKFAKARMVPNIQNWIFFTNKLDAISFEDDDRRVWVYQSPAKKLPDAHYATLWDWYGQDGIAKVVRWLLDRTIGSSFNPNACPVDTLGHKQAMGIAAASAPVAAVIAQFQVGGRFETRELVATHEVMRVMERGVRGAAVHQRHVGEAIRHLGGICLTDNAISTKAGRVRVWATSTVATAKWRSAVAEEIRNAFEREIAGDGDL